MINPFEGFKLYFVIIVDSHCCFKTLCGEILCTLLSHPPPQDLISLWYSVSVRTPMLSFLQPHLPPPTPNPRSHQSVLYVCNFVISKTFRNEVTQYVAFGIDSYAKFSGIHPSCYVSSSLKTHSTSTLFLLSHLRIS